MTDTLHIQNIDAIQLTSCGRIRIDPPFPEGEDPIAYEIFFPIIEADGKENMGCGCGFDCDRNGFIDLGQMNEAAYANFISLLREGTTPGNSRRYGPGRIRSWRVRPVRERSWLVCDCGKPVYLDGFTCTCACGRDYSSSGQLLAPREQWGWETGETADEIIRGVKQDLEMGVMRSPEDTAY